MIPKVFHRVWIPTSQDDVIPTRHETFWNMLKELHQGWDFKTWDRGEHLFNQELFDAATNHATRSDILRYEVLFEEGGIYVDTDVEPLRSFEPLLNSKPWMAYESDSRLCPSVIGATRGHPALRCLVEGLEQWGRDHSDTTDPVVLTGPIYVTDKWQFRSDVVRLPPWTFYSVGPTERRLLGSTYHEDAYAIHHWAKGWK